MTHTTHIAPTTPAADLRQQMEALRAQIERLLAEGHTVAITVANEREELTPQQAAERLGFSRQHVRRLVDAGELEAHQLTSSQHWRIPLTTILTFEERREAAEQRAAQHSRDLDRLGAPLE